MSNRSIMKRNKTEKIQGFVLLSLGVGPWQEYSVGMEAKDKTETRVSVCKSATELSWGKPSLPRAETSWQSLWSMVTETMMHQKAELLCKALNPAAQVEQLKSSNSAKETFPKHSQRQKVKTTLTISHILFWEEICQPGTQQDPLEHEWLGAAKSA